jgi:hypothetical protein
LSKSDNIAREASTEEQNERLQYPSLFSVEPPKMPEIWSPLQQTRKSPYHRRVFIDTNAELNSPPSRKPFIRSPSTGNFVEKEKKKYQYHFRNKSTPEGLKSFPESSFELSFHTRHHQKRVTLQFIQKKLSKDNNTPHPLEDSLLNQAAEERDINLSQYPFPEPIPEPEDSPNFKRDLDRITTTLSTISSETNLKEEIPHTHTTLKTMCNSDSSLEYNIPPSLNIIDDPRPTKEAEILDTVHFGNQEFFLSHLNLSGHAPVLPIVLCHGDYNVVIYDLFTIF